MNTRFIATFGSCLLAALIVAMWLQIRDLEKRVDILTRTSTGSRLIPVSEFPPVAIPNRQNSVFKLIGSQRPAQPTVPEVPKSDIGVPWDVERAMMRDANRNALPMQKPENLDRTFNKRPAEPTSR
jgi:hypothetical protein